MTLRSAHQGLSLQLAALPSNPPVAPTQRVRELSPAAAGTAPRKGAGLESSVAAEPTPPNLGSPGPPLHSSRSPPRGFFLPVLAPRFVDVPVGASPDFAALVLEQILHPLALGRQLGFELVVHVFHPWKERLEKEGREVDNSVRRRRRGGNWQHSGARARGHHTGHHFLVLGLGGVGGVPSAATRFNHGFQELESQGLLGQVVMMEARIRRRLGKTGNAGTTRPRAACRTLASERLRVAARSLDYC